MREHVASQLTMFFNQQSANVPTKYTQKSYLHRVNYYQKIMALHINKINHGHPAACSTSHQTHTEALCYIMIILRCAICEPSRLILDAPPLALTTIRVMLSPSHGHHILHLSRTSEVTGRVSYQRSG